MLAFEFHLNAVSQLQKLKKPDETWKEPGRCSGRIEPHRGNKRLVYIYTNISARQTQDVILGQVAFVTREIIDLGGIIQAQNSPVSQRFVFEVLQFASTIFAR